MCRREQTQTYTDRQTDQQTSTALQQQTRTIIIQIHTPPKVEVYVVCPVIPKGNTTLSNTQNTLTHHKSAKDKQGNFITNLTYYSGLNLHSETSSWSWVVEII